MKRYCLTALVAVLVFGCSSTNQPRPPRPEELRGTAGWVGQEFAGRTTANGEIFDPLQLTAAHRTLPFGTILTVKNTKTGQTVRVRVNDRGPYIANRVVDLSYAAAKRIGLVEGGGGPVEMTVVKLGQGDREPPAPYVVSVPEVKPLPAPTTTEPPPMAPAVTSDTPAVATNEPARVAPVAAETKPAPQPASEPPATVPVIATPVETRRQVSSDGRRVETVPVEPQPPPIQMPVTPAPPSPPPVTAAAAAAATPRPARRAVAGSASGKYAVQVGAYSQQSNAKIAMDELARIGEPSFIDQKRLLVVCAGPFDTLEAASQSRDRIVRAGMEAIIIKRR